MLFRYFAHLCEVVVIRENRADIAEHRFEDECRHILVIFQQHRQRFGVIIGHLQRVTHHIEDDTGRIRHTHCGRTGTCLDQHAVMGAMKPPLNLDDVITPGKPAGKPNSGHRRL